MSFDHSTLSYHKYKSASLTLNFILLIPFFTGVASAKDCFLDIKGGIVLRSW